MTDSASGFSTPDSALEAELSAGLADIESGIRAAIASDYSFVTEVSRHLVEAGGALVQERDELLAGAAEELLREGALAGAVGEALEAVGDLGEELLVALEVALGVADLDAEDPEGARGEGDR